jgi:acyl carrier protein
MRERIRSIMADVFSADLAAIDDKANPQRIEKWDSVRHIYLILALEQRLGIEIDDDEIGRMVSLEAIVETVSAKQTG